jgi:acid stress-induced BolA-like protein IbaG/YrbA
MYSFCVDRLKVQDLMEKGRNFHFQIASIKKKFQEKSQIREEKIRTLQLVAEQIKSEITGRLASEPSKTMSEFMQNVTNIKPEILYAALKQYMKQCDMKHAVGFY